MQNLILGKTYLVNFGTFIFTGIYIGIGDDLHTFEYVSNEGYGEWHSTIFRAGNDHTFILFDNLSYEFW